MLERMGMQGRLIYAYMLAFVALLVAGFLYFFGAVERPKELQNHEEVAALQEAQQQEVPSQEPLVVSSLAPEQGDTVAIRVLAEERPVVLSGATHILAPAPWRRCHS